MDNHNDERFQRRLQGQVDQYGDPLGPIKSGLSFLTEPAAIPKLGIDAIRHITDGLASVMRDWRGGPVMGYQEPKPAAGLPVNVVHGSSNKAQHAPVSGFVPVTSMRHPANRRRAVSFLRQMALSKPDKPAPPQSSPGYGLPGLDSTLSKVPRVSFNPPGMTTQEPPALPPWQNPMYSDIGIPVGAIPKGPFGGILGLQMAAASMLPAVANNLHRKAVMDQFNRDRQAALDAYGKRLASEKYAADTGLKNAANVASVESKYLSDLVDLRKEMEKAAAPEYGVANLTTTDNLGNKTTTPYLFNKKARTPEALGLIPVMPERNLLKDLLEQNMAAYRDKAGLLSTVDPAEVLKQTAEMYAYQTGTVPDIAYNPETGQALINGELVSLK